jgi:peptidyl-prolyl cis-trans isomerase B (cyclophilin B)
MMRKLLQSLLAFVLVAGVFVTSGCASQADTSLSVSPSPSESISPTAIASADANLPNLNGKATVEMVVKGETVTIEVDGTNAPVTAGNFIDLVQQGVYNGLVFHRVVREPQPFVVQGGDPQSKDTNFPAERLGTGSYIDPATTRPRYIPLEIKPQGADKPVYHQTLETAGITTKPKLRHTRGAVAMARSSLPDSASSQFYVALTDLSFLDGNYAVFGYVTKGMETVDRIQQGDRIESVKVVKGSENLKKG